LISHACSFSSVLLVVSSLSISMIVKLKWCWEVCWLKITSTRIGSTFTLVVNGGWWMVDAVGDQ
jgi:hypothetical protein